MFNISNDRGTETTPAVKILGPGTASTGSGGSSIFRKIECFLFVAVPLPTVGNWWLRVR